jgi:hypothetical protein
MKRYFYNTTMKADECAPAHIVIVGAGIAGLICAKELLKLNPSVRVTIVEATDHPGGRIRGVRYHGIEIDVGAEFVHGPGTVLTDLVEELYGEADKAQSTPTNKKTQLSSALYEPIFVVSHADGGPDADLTIDGKYGMYYMDGMLRPYDDPSAIELRQTLDHLFYPEESNSNNDESSNIGDIPIPAQDEMISIGEALDRSELSAKAQELAVPSYGNTAGCTDLHQLSLPIMKQFENYWFKFTTSGDFRFSSKSNITMTSVLDRLVQQLLKEERRLQLLYKWKAISIRQKGDTLSSLFHSEANEKAVHITSDRNDSIFCDAVIVTVAPPMLQKLEIDLSPKKLQALSLVGFPRVVKVILIFASPDPPWPKALNGVICADGLPIPEIWFTEKLVNTEVDQTSVGTQSMNGTMNVLHLAVGYLTSQQADDFIKKVDDDMSTSNLERKEEHRNNENICMTCPDSRHASAARIFIHQLATVLNVSECALNDLCVDCILYDWKVDEPMVQGGYMYGKKGMTTEHLYDLAEPQGHFFFAGEATNTNACCTVQAAMETGIRAAKEVSQYLAHKACT